ncbi:MAG: hypothetical protein K5837_01975 [Candidatus Saccharibacteria bacterium]|nr:hypothetical protein [Candidatus Saccharibacteria bacterium]
MLFFKSKSVESPVSVLFRVIDEEFAMGICCNIDFIYKNKKHEIGVYGDDGNTYKNVRFYFDKDEYNTREELLENARIDGVRVCDLKETVTVTECDGCYPDSTEAFRALV